jgi:hypothetical protein
MAYTQLLYINDYAVPNLTSYDDLLSEQDGENSGRTPTLKMNRDILGRIASITAKVEFVDRATGQKILNILKKHNITVKFLNSETGNYSTISCYCVDPKKELAVGLMSYYKYIEFTLNSNSKFD